MEQIGYNKNADAEYTSSSIFCAKVKGYSVPWHEAKEAVHCDMQELRIKEGFCRRIKK